MLKSSSGSSRSVCTIRHGEVPCDKAYQGGERNSDEFERVLLLRPAVATDLLASLEIPMTLIIDELLTEFRFCTVIEGAKVRDLLLDLRNLVTAEE